MRRYLLLAVLVSAGAAAQSDQNEDPGFSVTPKAVVDDVKDYVTAPLRWDKSDWLFFGGTLAAFGAAHHYDDTVRTHFASKLANPLDSKDTHEAQDAIPAAAILGGTWLLATINDNNWGRWEGWSMLEASVLGVGTAYVLKFAAGRERPDETTDPNEWNKSGSSFPSTHSVAAFAIGTVLAESGDDEYRWLRRFIGYGAAAATGYERLKHNAHWLSDVVVGSALGVASARFTLNRSHTPAEDSSSLVLLPMDGGVMLSYSKPVR